MEIKNKTLKAIYDTVPLMDQEEYIQYFKILGDEIRHCVCREIFMNPGITGKEILVKFDVSQPTLSFHIAQLMKAKLVTEQKRGQSHYYYPNYIRVLSFEKTTAEYQMKVGAFIGDVYKTLVACIKEGKCSGQIPGKCCCSKKKNKR